MIQKAVRIKGENSDIKGSCSKNLCVCEVLASECCEIIIIKHK